MEKSPLIYQKIPAIMAKVWAIAKGRKNASQGYQFRGIDDMYNALNKHFAEEWVFAVGEIIDSSREERATKSGWVLTYTTLDIRYTFCATDGSFVQTTTRGEAMDSGDKASNKAMSTAYKYALMQIFCIPTEEEKDTEYHSPEIVPKEKSTPKTQKVSSNPATEEQIFKFVLNITTLAGNIPLDEKIKKAQITIKSLLNKDVIGDTLEELVAKLTESEADNINTYLNNKITNA